MRILAVDPGDLRIGLALSDATATLASPLIILDHINREENARRIADLAAQHGAERIIVGQAFGEDGKPNLSGRKARRLAGALRDATSLPVELWEESDSTQTALAARRALGMPGDNIDAEAAAVILQDYLDNHDDPSPH
jgi:putative Holliday junction resolvase